MHKLIVTGLIAVDALLFVALPLQAKEVKGKIDCTATIAAAQNHLEAGRNVEVTIRSSDISESYPDHPKSRSFNYKFLLSKEASESIMNSSNLIKSIANKIINNCRSVGSVTFGINQTGWSQSIGLMPDGKVKFFECLEPNESSKELSWGQEYCSL